MEKKWGAIALCLAAMALSVCNDPLTPEEISGHYNLVSVDYARLPFVLREGYACTLEDGTTGSGILYILSGGLDLNYVTRESGLVVQGYHIRIDERSSCRSDDGTSAAENYVVIDNGRFEIEDKTVTFISVFREQETLFGQAQVSGRHVDLTLDHGWSSWDIGNFGFWRESQ